jgi:hypothetical protein
MCGREKNTVFQPYYNKRKFTVYIMLWKIYEGETAGAYYWGINTTNFKGLVSRKIVLTRSMAVIQNNWKILIWITISRSEMITIRPKFYLRFKKFSFETFWGPTKY